MRETSESCLMLETLIDIQQAHCFSLKKGKERKKKENPSCSDGRKEITGNFADCFLWGSRLQPESAQSLASHQELGGAKRGWFLHLGWQLGATRVLRSTPLPQGSGSRAGGLIHSPKGEGLGWQRWCLGTSLPASSFVQRTWLSRCFQDRNVKDWKRESVLHAFKHRDCWYCHCLGLPTNNAPSWVIYSQCIIFDGWRAEKLFNMFGKDCSCKVREQYLISILKPILETPDKLPEDGVCKTQS